MWNFALAAHGIALQSPDRVALAHGDRKISYGQLDRRTDALASALSSLDLPPGAHVGHYMRNRPEYMETVLACGKVGLAHVNVNYRYTVDELAYLLGVLDVEVLVYGREFADKVAALKVVEGCSFHAIEIADDPKDSGPPANGFAMSYEQIVGEADVLLPRDWDYSADTQIIIATGGTTGMPKGVMWRNEDLFNVLNVQRMLLLGPREPQDIGSMEDHLANLARLQPAAVFGAFAPLMHGAALMTALCVIGQGGQVVTVPGSAFDARRYLAAVRDKGINIIGIVGDAFALPMCEVLEAEPQAGYLDGLRLMTSTGAALSTHHKETLLKHAPGVLIVDALGSSESGPMATSVSMKAPGMAPGTPRFQGTPMTIVVDAQMRPVPPGSDEIGMVAKRGPVPLGYYNDPEKTAATFPTIDGVRYVMTGDAARVNADGSIAFLGRGSGCINTGGEKVYAEEVEDALRALPSIDDALVVGLPHPRFGSQVAAVANPRAGHANASVAEIQSALANVLADYKVPRVLVLTDALIRLPNGKGDYGKVKELAQQHADAKG